MVTRPAAYAIALMASMACIASLMACGDEYRCPDPIGPIVRDDCEVYETRYEALAVELGVTFAGFGVSVGGGDEALRDPSELLQVLRLQTMALCRDYNACRVRPGEYRARRQAMDQKYTAIIALSEQLRAADDTATRRQLVDRLVEAVRAPVAVEGPPTKPRQRRAIFRRDTHMWIGGVHMAPAAPQPTATPALAWWQPIQVRGARAPTTRVFLTFRGEAAADDFAYAILPDGTEARCAVKPSGPRADDPERAPQARATCDFEIEVPPTTGRLAIDYRPGLTGERHRLGTVPLDPAARQREAWLAYLPSPVDHEPIDHARPWLVVFLPERPDRNVTMRCNNREAPVGGVIKARSSMRRVAGLTRYHLPLPISLPRPGRVREASGDLLPSEAAGEWTCRISVLGAEKRRVTFTLDATGHPVVEAPSGGIAPPWWPLHAPRG